MRGTGGEGGRSLGCRLRPEARESRLKTQRTLVQFVVRKVTRRVEHVTDHLRTPFDLVRRLLEVFDFPDDVSDLWQRDAWQRRQEAEKRRA